MPQLIPSGMVDEVPVSGALLKGDAAGGAVAATSGTDYYAPGNTIPVADGGTGSTTAANARTALGLGTSAVTAATDYATSAQGIKADAALPSLSVPVVSSLATTTNTTVTIPAGHVIQNIVVQNITANAVTGGVRVGTTDTGVDVVVALTVGASSLTTVLDSALLKRVFSMSVDTTLYVQAVAAWNSASLNIYFSLRKVT